MQKKKEKTNKVLAVHVEIGTDYDHSTIIELPLDDNKNKQITELLQDG